MKRIVARRCGGTRVVKTRDPIRNMFSKVYRASQVNILYYVPLIQ